MEEANSATLIRNVLVYETLPHCSSPPSSFSFENSCRALRRVPARSLLSGVFVRRTEPPVRITVIPDAEWVASPPKFFACTHLARATRNVGRFSGLEAVHTPTKVRTTRDAMAALPARTSTWGARTCNPHERFIYGTYSPSPIALCAEPCVLFVRQKSQPGL